MEHTDRIDFGDAVCDWQAIRHLVKRLELPDNFRVKTEESAIRDYPLYFVYVYAHWPNLDPDGETWSQTYSSMTVDDLIDYKAPLGLFVEKLYAMIRDLWVHELHEQLRIDNRFIRHPHPQGRKGPLG